MKQGALVSFNKLNMPKIASYFKLPKITKSFNIAVGEDSFGISFIEYPLASEENPNSRKDQVLKKLLEDNHIEVSIEIGSLIPSFSEIFALKEWAALVKTSTIKNTNFLRTNIALLTSEISDYRLDLFSDEATSLLIFERASLSESRKREIFNRLMVEKGVSVIFYNKLEKIIPMAQVLIVDDQDALLTSMPFERLIKDRILINQSHITLFSTPKEEVENQEILTQYNNEILYLLRFFYSQEKPIEFVKKFPYLYSL